MVSFNFPSMLSTSSAQLVENNDATLSNLKLLLLSRKGSLFGDPYFGTNLESLIYEQNSNLLIDVIKDEIFTDIFEFMPQLRCTRNDINVYSKGTAVYAEIKATNLLNGEVNLYKIRLIEDGED